MATHRHRCPDCQRLFRCDAEVIDNHDGWPARVCRAELSNGYVVKPKCEDCQEEAHG